MWFTILVVVQVIILLSFISIISKSLKQLKAADDLLMKFIEVNQTFYEEQKSILKVFIDNLNTFLNELKGIKTLHGNMQKLTDQIDKYFQEYTKLYRDFAKDVKKVKTVSNSNEDLVKAFEKMKAINVGLQKASTECQEILSVARKIKKEK